MNIAPEIVRELLHYDPDTGIFTWRARGRRWFKSEPACKSWNSKFSGKRAGCVWTQPGTGYQSRQVAVLGCAIKEHRLAWMWMTDDPLPDEIDHDNRDGTDNRWSNLRDADGKNQRNKSMQENNTSGATGVSKSSRTGKWVAQCWVDGTNRTIGQFTMKHRAIEALRDFREKHGYRDGHGETLAPYRA